MKKRRTRKQHITLYKTIIILASIVYIWSGLGSIQTIFSFITSPATSLNPFADVIHVSIGTWMLALIVLSYIAGSALVIAGTLRSKRWAYSTNAVLSILYAFSRSLYLIMAPIAIFLGGQSFTIILPDLARIGIAVASTVAAMRLIDQN